MSFHTSIIFLQIFITVSVSVSGTETETGTERGPKMACETCTYSSTYEHIIVSGLPFQRGQSHGTQAREKIHKMINLYKSSKSMPSWGDCIEFVERNYIQALETFYPNGLEEMRGIADGAEVPLNDIIILNARYDLSRWKRSRDMRFKRVTPIKSSSQKPECPSDQNATIINSDDQSIVRTSGEINSRDSKREEEECTGAVVLKSGTLKRHVLLGQNWDTSEFILKNDTAILLEVHPDPCEKIKPFVTLTEAGQLIRSGMNGFGLGIVAMSLWSSDEVFEIDHIKHPYGWVPASLLRRMFLEAPTFPLGLRAILKTPRHVAMNVIVATGEDEALNIELTPTSYFITQVPLDKEILTHSNHFKSPGFLAKDSISEGSRGSSSLFRDRRVEKALTRAWPDIEEEHFQMAFKDHVGYPNSVCEHSFPQELAWASSHPTETTVASIIFNLSKRTLQLCKGPPCMGTYNEFIFNFSLPLENSSRSNANTD